MDLEKRSFNGFRIEKFYWTYNKEVLMYLDKRNFNG